MSLTDKIRSAVAVAERIEQNGGHVLSLRTSKYTRETRIVPGLHTCTDDVRRILDDARIIHKCVNPYRLEITVREGEMPSGAIIIVRRAAEQLPEVGSTPDILAQVVNDLENAGLDVHSAEWNRGHNRMSVHVTCLPDVDMTNVVRDCSLKARWETEPGISPWYSGDICGMRLEVMP